MEFAKKQKRSQWISALSLGACLATGILGMTSFSMDGRVLSGARGPAQVRNSLDANAPKAVKLAVSCIGNAGSGSAIELGFFFEPKKDCEARLSNEEQRLDCSAVQIAIRETRDNGSQIQLAMLKEVNLSIDSYMSTPNLKANHLPMPLSDGRLDTAHFSVNANLSAHSGAITISPDSDNSVERKIDLVCNGDLN